MKRHLENIHSQSIHKYQCREVQDNGSYTIDFKQGQFNKCPVPQCTGGGKEKFGIYCHFCLIHPQADICIREDGKLPKCNKCGMRVKDLTKHIDSYTCKKGASRRTNEIKQDNQNAADDVKFYIHDKEIEKVRYFKYLGRVLSDDDSDSLCIENNLKKARGQWNKIAKILKREEASAKCMAKFYITVIQAVLLYGADTWTVSKHDYNKLQSFHKRVTRYLTNLHIQKVRNDEWIYPDHEELLKKCELYPIDIYLQRRRGTLREYLDTYKKNLLREAENCSRHQLNVHKILWWKQPYLTKNETGTLSNFWRL